MKPLRWVVELSQGVLIAQHAEWVFMISELRETAFLDVQVCDGETVLHEFSLGAYPRVKEAQEAAENLARALDL